MSNKKNIPIEHICDNMSINVSMDTISNGSQVLLFVNSINESRRLAEAISQYVKKYVNSKTLNELKKISEQILQYGIVNDNITKLAELIQCGVAFHNADLNDSCREIIEKNYRLQNIKIIVCTPTLSAGVNLPAHRVVISNMKVYRNGSTDYIPLHEYEQMCGRAARIAYHTEGDAIAICNGDRQKIMDGYVEQNGITLRSNIMNNDSWKKFIINILIFKPGLTTNTIIQFFRDTLNGNEINIKIEDISKHIETLCAYKMINNNNGYRMTTFGIVASRNIENPEVTNELYDYLVDASKTKKYTIGLTYIISRYLEQKNIPLKYNEQLLDIIKKHDETWFTIPIENCSVNFIVMQMFINGESEIKIKEYFDGIYINFKYIKYNSRNICHDMINIAKYIKNQNLINIIEELQTRLEYGIKAELIDLIRLGISHEQAYTLYKNNIKNFKELNEISELELIKRCRFTSKTSKMIKQKFKNGIQY